MIWRWIPLAILACWVAVVRWRIHWQEQRFGVDPVHLREDGGWQRKLRESFGRLIFFSIVVESILVVRGVVSMTASDVARWIGAALGFGGALLMLSAQLQMGISWRIGIDPNARTPLVTRGWYRVCRNPIYAFMFSSWIGFAVLVPNVFTWLAFMTLVLGIRRQIAHEEAWLTATYGSEWRVYAARVGRFVPFLGRIRA